MRAAFGFAAVARAVVAFGFAALARAVVAFAFGFAAVARAVVAFGFAARAVVAFAFAFGVDRAVVAFGVAVAVAEAPPAALVRRPMRSGRVADRPARTLRWSFAGRLAFFLPDFSLILARPVTVAPGSAALASCGITPGPPITRDGCL